MRQKRGRGETKSRTISLKNANPMSCTGAAGPPRSGPAGGAEAVHERLNVLTSAHTTRVSSLNALTFCTAVNNSCPEAVGGIRFRQKGRTPMSSSLNIHCLLFAGAMCGSHCKLKWACVRWHLWIQNYLYGYLWSGGGGQLPKEKSGFWKSDAFF